jgi:hypothetical protein
MAKIFGCNQVAGIDDHGIREESETAVRAFALDVHICGTDDLGPAAIGIGLRRAIGDNDIERAAIDIGTGAIAQAANNGICPGREEYGLARIGRGRDTAYRKICGNRMIAAIIHRLGFREIHERARWPDRLLTPDNDVPGTDQVDAVSGTTALNDDIETTFASRLARNLNRRTNLISAGREHAARRGSVGDGGEDRTGANI